MTEKIPSIENQESNEAHQELTQVSEVQLPEKKLELDPETLNEIKALKYKLEFEQSLTGLTNKKDDGSKRDGEIYNLDENRPKPKGGVKTALLAISAGFMSLFASKEAKAGSGPEDSLGKKPLTENIKSNGGIEVKEGLKIREISPKERADWNNFIDFVESKGLKGSEKLDKGSDALARNLFDEYKKLHPNTTIDYGSVASFQYEMQKLKEQAQGFAERRNDPNAKKIMSFVSKVDGWFGSKTSQSKFPFMIENTYHNDNLVSSENLGLLGADLTPEKKEQIMKKVPLGKKLEELSDGYYYENDDGDLVKVSNK
jgi:hypothetical protein